MPESYRQEEPPLRPYGDPASWFAPADHSTDAAATWPAGGTGVPARADDPVDWFAPSPSDRLWPAAEPADLLAFDAARWQSSVDGGGDETWPSYAEGDEAWSGYPEGEEAWSAYLADAPTIPLYRDDDDDERVIRSHRRAEPGRRLAFRALAAAVVSGSGLAVAILAAGYSSPEPRPADDRVALPAVTRTATPPPTTQPPAPTTAPAVTGAGTTTAPRPPAVVNRQPTTGATTSSSSPSPTPTPAPSPTPTPTPSETPEPTPSPEPSPTPEASDEATPTPSESAATIVVP